MAAISKADFFKLFTAMFDQVSILRIRYAYRFAKDVHRNQKRKEADCGDFRYFTHPRAVAAISMQYAMDADLIIACLLHDVIEDGNDPMDAVEIEFFLGSVVITTVRRVSKMPKEGFHERFVAHADWRSIWVKMCDRLHNLRTLPQSNPGFCAKQLKETREDYLPTFRKMPSMVPPEYRKGAEALLAEIEAFC